MSIEKSRSNSIDEQWIRDNETKEFEYGYSKSEELKTAYQKVVERLALHKIKNELLFNGMLDAQLRSFSRDGITISKEQLIKDINKEVARQQVNFGLDYDIALDVQQPQIETDIDMLKNNLDSIFEPVPQQPQQSNISNSTISNDPVHTRQEEIPTTTFTGNLENLSDEVKEQIITLMEARGGEPISSIDNIYQEGNLIVVDAKDTQGRYIGTEFTVDELKTILNLSPSIEEKQESSSIHR